MDTPSKGSWRTKGANAFIYGLVSLIMWWGSIVLVTSWLGDAREQQNARIDRNAAISVQEAVKTRKLLCRILIHSNNPDVVKAVKLYCGE